MEYHPRRRSRTMRKLSETELYSLHLTKAQMMEIHNAVNNKLNQNVGVIAPEHIKPELIQLETTAKKKPGLIADAIALFKDFNGRIRPFNLGVTTAGRSPIPPFMPFLPGNARNRAQEGDPSLRGVSPAMYVNMYRIGRWTADESAYEGLAVPTDLFACLESGVIAYKLLIEQKAEDIFSNTSVLTNFTNIYASLFSNAVVKTVVTYGTDFNTDAARFLIGKFFLRYVLKKPQSDTLDEVAYSAIKYRTSMSGLKTFEENYQMDYGTLSGFLKTLGEAFFSKPIDLAKFEVSWLSLYGEGMLFAVEYAPYLLHFLFATWHGAMLGGSNKMLNRQQDLFKDGLLKLYNTVISELR
jgi:hypothetical protein